MIKNTALKLTAGIAALTCWIALCGCVYDSPITAKPTAKVNPGFLGNWTSQDGKDKMKVSQYDDNNYVLTFNGDLYHAWESDVGGTPFFSVQTLDSTDGKSVNKFTYFTWKLADDGTLHGRTVNDKVIPDDTQGFAAVQKLLKANLKNPDLFNSEEAVFVKDK